MPEHFIYFIIITHRANLIIKDVDLIVIKPTPFVLICPEDEF